MNQSQRLLNVKSQSQLFSENSYQNQKIILLLVNAFDTSWIVALPKSLINWEITCNITYKNYRISYGISTKETFYNISKDIESYSSPVAHTFIHTKSEEGMFLIC